MSQFITYCFWLIISVWVYCLELLFVPILRALPTFTWFRHLELCPFVLWLPNAILARTRQVEVWQFWIYVGHAAVTFTLDCNSWALGALNQSPSGHALKWERLAFKVGIWFDWLLNILVAFQFKSGTNTWNFRWCGGAFATVLEDSRTHFRCKNSVSHWIRTQSIAAWMQLEPMSKMRRIDM